MNDTAVPLAPAVPPDLGGLLDQAARGDVAAAAAVYDLVSVPVYRLVRLVVADPVLAADICRRGFSHLWSAWAATVDDDGRPLSPQTWTLTLMYRFATEHMRPTMTSGPYVSVAFGSDGPDHPRRAPQRRPLHVIRGAARGLDHWRRRVK